MLGLGLNPIIYAMCYFGPDTVLQSIFWNTEESKQILQ